MRRERSLVGRIFLATRRRWVNISISPGANSRRRFRNLGTSSCKNPVKAGISLRCPPVRAHTIAPAGEPAADHQARGYRRRQRFRHGSGQANRGRRLAATHPRGSDPTGGVGRAEAERTAGRPSGSRRRSMGLPRADLRDAPRPRCGRLHQPLNRRPAGPRPASRDRRLDHEAVSPRRGDRPSRSRLAPSPSRAPAGRGRPGGRRRSWRSAPTASRPSSAKSAST